MKRLSKDCFNKACQSIKEYGRPLEQTLLKKYFFNGQVESIILELKKFQNQDGGFGHGLESDFKMPYSSPMATSVGIRILSELDELEETQQMIKAAIMYLEKSFIPERNGWFAVSEEVNSFPHAPWWHYDKEKKMTVIDNNWGNPSAEIIAYIYKYKDYVKELEADKLVEYAINYFENKDEFGSEHELYCYAKLYNILPKDLKKRIETNLVRAIEQLISYDENQWHEYVPTPIDFVKGPDSNTFGIPESMINQNLDFIIDKLEQDGKINPPWGMDYYDEDLKEAYNEWAGVLTLNSLIILSKFSRIEINEN